MPLTLEIILQLEGLLFVLIIGMKKKYARISQNQLKSAKVYSKCMIITIDYLFDHTQCELVQILILCYSHFL